MEKTKGFVRWGGWGGGEGECGEDMMVEPKKSRKSLERISVIQHSSSINLGNLG
jgi:hypothetical protein